MEMRGDVTDAGRTTNYQTNSEDRATQPMQWKLEAEFRNFDDISNYNVDSIILKFGHCHDSFSLGPFF